MRFLKKLITFENLKKRFLSVPLSGPMDKYYVTSSYGYRKDPYTKEELSIKA